jgi:dienelactone hydrolase
MPRLTAATLVLVLGGSVGAACTSGADRPPANPGIREEAVAFRNGDVTLAGTAVLAAGRGRHPAVLLFHGSGPEPRNLAMARWWAAQGVTALTYDKRGVGESTGDFRTVPFMTLHLDGLAGVAWLKARPDVDPARIGVWGLSQGGWLGPLAAAHSSDIAFVVAVSGPGVSPGEQMVFYYASQLRLAGVPDGDVAEATAVRRQVWTAASTGRGLAAARTRLEALQAATTSPDVRRQLADLRPALDGASRAWITEEMPYDPVPALQHLTVPSLFLFGTADVLVPVDRSVAIIRQTLTEAGRSDYTIHVIAGADHGMYVASPDGPPHPSDEYYDIMRDWVRTHVLH